ncbi:MAG: M24 family metallopeptidase [Candidatus Aenigmarchaeota archaeon]|nr:M24 family metallopeptidase [Candidatus Aenigmarchaeota archaeon]
MKKKRPDIHAQLKRIIKTRAELALLRKSARITDSCVAVLQRELKRKGVTEKQLAAAIDRKIRKQHAQLAFPTIVTCGKHGKTVHANPSRRIVRGLGYADFGAMWNGYRTDITVPFVKGALGAKEKRILDTTLKAYAALTKLPRSGMLCWKMQDRFDAFLKKRGYVTMHSLGHGIGLDIHELPSLTKLRRSRLRKMGPRKKKRVLERWRLVKELRFEPDQVFTIEPGVYVEGVGGCRYENDFLMTARGAKPITHSRLLRAD